MINPEITAITDMVKGYNMTTQNLEKAVTRLRKDPELYKKVAALANRRLKSLRKKRMVGRSKAYQNLKNEYGLTSNRPYVTGKMLNRDKVKAVIRFVAAEGSTVTGIKKIEANKRSNVIKQIMTYSDISQEDKAILEDYLKSLSENKLKNLIDAYSDILSSQYIAGSPTKFNFIGNHLIAQAQKFVSTNTKTMVSQIKQDMKNYMSSIDPVDAKNKTSTDFGNDFGMNISEIIPGVIESDKKGASISREALMQALG